MILKIFSQPLRSEKLRQSFPVRRRGFSNSSGSDWRNALFPDKYFGVTHRGTWALVGVVVCLQVIYLSKRADKENADAVTLREERMRRRDQRLGKSEVGL